MRFAAFAVLATGVVAVVAGSASASLVVKGAGGSWQAFPSSLNDYSNPTRAYWDQDSKDRAGAITNRNIGNYLNGSWTGSLPGGAAASPMISPSWWGKASTPDFLASMDNGIGFDLSAPSDRVASQLRLEVAGYAPANEIGWYSLADAAGAETLHTIISGPMSPIVTNDFVPAGEFGLYIKTGGNKVFFTESSRNRTTSGSALSSADRATQHFAIFASSLVLGAEEYYVGVEDLARSEAGIECVGDYNDMVIKISAVPTPGAMALLAMGGIVAGRRRR